MVQRLVRQQRDVEAAQDDRHAARAEPVGQRVRRVDPGGEARDAHQIELGQRLERPEVVDLEVRDLVAGRREPRHGQEPEARQGRDDLPPANEARQRHPERGELGGAHPDAAHGDEADLHGRSGEGGATARCAAPRERPTARSRMAAISAATGKRQEVAGGIPERGQPQEGREGDGPEQQEPAARAAHDVAPASPPHPRHVEEVERGERDRRDVTEPASDVGAGRRTPGTRAAARPALRRTTSPSRRRPPCRRRSSTRRLGCWSGPALAGPRVAFVLLAGARDHRGSSLAPLHQAMGMPRRTISVDTGGCDGWGRDDPNGLGGGTPDLGGGATGAGGARPPGKRA